MTPADAASLLADSPAPLAWVAADGSLAWCNPACRSLLGGRSGTLAECLDVVDAAALAAVMRDGGRAELQRRGGHAGDSWVRLDVVVRADGSRIVALAGLDAERAREAEARRLSELLDLTRDIGRVGLWERDLRTGRARWDRNMFRIYGLGEEGGPPPVSQVRTLVIPADREAYDRLYVASLERPGRHELVFRVRLPDGRLRHLDSRWVVQAGADGRPARAYGLLMDDTRAEAMARSYGEMVSQLALAVDLAGIAIWRHDLATDTMHYSDQAWRVIGQEPRPEGLPLAEVRSLIHPDDLPHVVASAGLALESDLPTDMEARYRRSDGQWRHVMTRRIVQRDPEGRPQAFLGVALDVTDRIDESRRAAELGRRIELVTGAANIGYWSLEPGQSRPRMSDQMRAIHGIADAAPGPTLDEWLQGFVHPEDRDRTRRGLIDWLRSGTPSARFELRLLRRDGEVRHIVAHTRLEGAPRVSPVFGLFMDVTEHRLAELARRAAVERATLAARGVGIGAWELGLHDGAVFWDEQMWRLRGLAPREAAPTRDEQMQWVHPEDRGAVVQRMQPIFGGDPAPANYEFRVVWPDGRVRWLASRSTAVHDERGEVVRRIGVNWDVTDSRTAEAVRQERELALRESQAKSKFLARMSHELRTPLNAVLGFAQLLLADERDDGGSRRRRLEHIRAAGQHLLELINDVLDLSSLEGGEVQIAVQPVALAPLVGELLPLLDPLLREHGIELAPGALDVVPMADPTRLRQVLLNLLGNAVKYNRPGGRVTLDARVRGGQVIVRVADNGRGMSDTQLRHLFEPFNRLGIEREGIEGTGIGLAIVKALVERMGGSIHVDSTPGLGSVFEVRLADGRHVAPPAPAAPAPAAARLEAAAGATPLRGTLLYIEDNPVNALIISELIGRRPDLRLHVAADGGSGVRAATELQPDLVLLDMQLPDFDGHEVLRRLRARPETASIPVIALSANAMPEDIERALRAGMSDYWTKPLDFRAFMASIESLFGPPPG